jgi:dipeptidyl aminopeptidase/acylaminoacyl peptidase
MEADFGKPQWWFGNTTYKILSEDRLLCTYSSGGVWNIAFLNPDSRVLKPLPIPYTSINYVQMLNDKVLFIGASPTESGSLVQFDPKSRETRELMPSTQLQIDPGYVSLPKSIEFPTTGGATAYAFYYPPQNKDYKGPGGEPPPLLVSIHGGPTGATSPTFSPRRLYWTSRGFAIVDVNYRGSTGYGRAYRDSLKGEWGVADVDDCIHAADYLVMQGLVDPDRLAISGGSAGGFTTLMALTKGNSFKAGASYFGVSDLKLLAYETHKFESRYLDSLIGPLPEKEHLYEERSAINHIDMISAPLLLLQGLEDKIVPANQSEIMFESLRARGVPVAYIAYEGEQHGFRKAETIKHSLESTFYFFSRIFEFEPADELEPVEISNFRDK